MNRTARLGTYRVNLSIFRDLLIHGYCVWPKLNLSSKQHQFHYKERNNLASENVMTLLKAAASEACESF